MDVRQGFFAAIQKYWWILALILVVGALVLHVPIFQYALYVVGGFFLLSIFLPVLFQLFSPAFVLVSSLIEHFQSAREMPFFKKFLLIPLSLLAVVVFLSAQMVLTVWVFIVSFLIWETVIGGFFAILLIFFFGLAPVAIITAPFVIWFQQGFVPFLGTFVFFLMALFWYGLSSLSFSQDSYSSTPESFLGYSPQTYLLGALSCQVLALPFYNFKLFGIGGGFSVIGGLAFLVLTVMGAINWYLTKRKLTAGEQREIYKPPVWIYIIGCFVTSMLASSFQAYQANTAVLTCLNGFFGIALVTRFVKFIFRPRARKATGDA
ncbi:MAG: hypothetical protein HQL22_02825 [Candidatus Omnitrophica bacterium]|nr:hypothetical protein [Candidatus Omnitrophota bacterium]